MPRACKTNAIVIIYVHWIVGVELLLLLLLLLLFVALSHEKRKGGIKCHLILLTQFVAVKHRATENLLKIIYAIEKHLPHVFPFGYNQRSMFAFLDVRHHEISTKDV